MNGNATSSNKKYVLLLLGVLCAAIAAYTLLRGKIDLTTLGQVVKEPTDTQENLAYEENYHLTSDQVLQRDQIVIKNFGTSLKAQDLETGVCVDAADISEKSDREIQSFAEYVGYFYMYDGKDLYRTMVNEPEEMKTTVEDCLKFAPMGDYIYSLKEYNGQTRLYRCSITGTYEKLLFSEEIQDFWAGNGNLLLQLSDGTYRWYNVVSQDTLEHSLPENAREISIDGDAFFYLSEEQEGSCVLYRRDFDSKEDTALPYSSVADYSAAEENVALLLPTEGGSVQAAWCKGTGDDPVTFQKIFPEGSQIDVSGERLYVTEPEGGTWTTPLEGEAWEVMFDAEATG